MSGKTRNGCLTPCTLSPAMLKDSNAIKKRLLRQYRGRFVNKKKTSARANSSQRENYTTLFER